MSKMINAQDGIRPYRMENHSKIIRSYMYLYLVLKSIMKEAKFQSTFFYPYFMSKINFRGHSIISFQKVHLETP